MRFSLVTGTIFWSDRYVYRAVDHHSRVAHYSELKITSPSCCWTVHHKGPRSFGLLKGPLTNLRPVKPCPGVPGIHLNADCTVSMTAALLCGAGASPVHKDCGGSADHDQIEDYAHAQRHAWEMLLW